MIYNQRIKALSLVEAIVYSYLENEQLIYQLIYKQPHDKSTKTTH